MTKLINLRSALRAVFDHISLQIEKLVADQIAEVSDKNLTVKVRGREPYETSLLISDKAILLVGGFGENRYLYDRLVTCHANDGIQVMQVNGAFVSPNRLLFHTCTNSCRWSSICRGATLWGLEHSDLPSVTGSPTVVSRLSRYSYGMAFSQVYDHKKHLLQDRYMDTAEGIYRANGQMTWLLRRVRPSGLTPRPQGSSQRHRVKKSKKIAYWIHRAYTLSKWASWTAELDNSPPTSGIARKPSRLRERLMVHHPTI